MEQDEEICEFKFLENRLISVNVFVGVNTVKVDLKYDVSVHYITLGF